MCHVNTVLNNLQPGITLGKESEVMTVEVGKCWTTQLSIMVLRNSRVRKAAFGLIDASGAKIPLFFPAMLVFRAVSKAHLCS